MAAPSQPTAFEKAFDCVEWMLQQVNNANGFRTDGILVDRAMDPRQLRQNKTDEYEQKLAAVTLVPVSRIQDRTKSIGGRVVWDVTYQVRALVTLSAEEALNNDPSDSAAAKARKLDEKCWDLQDDIWRCLRRYYDFSAPAAALGISKPVVINHQAGQFLSGTPAAVARRTLRRDLHLPPRRA
jgi:hypothetical protein